MEGEDTFYISSCQLKVFDRELRDVLEEFNKYTDTPMGPEYYKKFIKHLVLFVHSDEWFRCYEVSTIEELISDENAATTFNQAIYEENPDRVTFYSVAVDEEKREYYVKNAEQIYNDMLSGNYLIDVEDILTAVTPALWGPIFNLFDFDERVRTDIKKKLKEKSQNLPAPYNLIFNLLLLEFEYKEKAEMEEEDVIDD